MKMHHIVWTILVVLVLLFVYKKWKATQQGSNPVMQ